MSPAHHYYTGYFTVDERATLLWTGSCHIWHHYTMLQLRMAW